MKVKDIRDGFIHEDEDIIITSLSEAFNKSLYASKDVFNLSQNMTKKIAKRWLKFELRQHLSWKQHESKELDKFFRKED